MKMAIVALAMNLIWAGLPWNDVSTANAFIAGFLMAQIAFILEEQRRRSL